MPRESPSHILLIVCSFHWLACGAVLLSTDVTSPLCFTDLNPGLTKEACCNANNPTCWDDFFSWTRCCEQRGARDLARAVRGRLLSCAASLRAAAPPAHFHMIEADGDMARLTSCAAREAQVAVDLFGGEGGTAWLLARTMNWTGSGLTRVITFENNARGQQTIHENLQSFAPQELSPAWRATVGGGLADGLWVLHGQPYPTYPGMNEFTTLLDKFEFEPSVLEEICRDISQRGETAIVTLDAQYPMVREWLVIESHCRPVFLVLSHTTFPHGDGWIRENLMMSGEWAELFAGIKPVPGYKGSGPTGPVLAGRRWSLLYRLQLQ